jgi:glycosyltransferase involved in cell wall biosynthesis
MKLVVVIPVYNHAGAIRYMVEGVLRHGLPCLLVDDGSDAECAAVLDRLAAAHPEAVILQRLPQNRGKGAAVLSGVGEALRRGYSHALQIDADGQHDPAEIPKFLAAAAAHPEAVICGVPQYDASVPKGRLYGRYLTHVWVSPSAIPCVGSASTRSVPSPSWPNASPSASAWISTPRCSCGCTGADARW